MAIFIDGVEIMSPSDLKVTKFDIKRQERTASGRLVADIIATKRALQLGWSIIKDEDIKHILDLLSAKTFHSITYPDPQSGESHTITACVDGNIQLASWRIVGGIRYWSDVSVSLVER